MKRDNYLDLCRGIAALNIVIIHTAFWSGGSYVPTIFQSLSLLLDVPFFFFLAGWGRTFSPDFGKTIKSLVEIYKKYIYFIAVYFLGLIIARTVDKTVTTGGLTNFLSYISFNNAVDTKLSVIMGSIWFMPVFMTVVPLDMLVITIIRRYRGDVKKGIRTFGVIAFIVFIWTEYGNGYMFITREIAFYSFMFVMGYWSVDKYINSKKVFVGLIGFFTIGTWLISLALGKNLWVIQDLKFPPTSLYLMLSMISIVIAIYGKNRLEVCEKNIFVIIGKNAVWFYLAQGVSSSFLLYIVDCVKLIWFIKYPIFIIINILLTSCLVFVLKEIYEVVTRYIKKVCITLKRESRDKEYSK